LQHDSEFCLFKKLTPSLLANK